MEWLEQNALRTDESIDASIGAYSEGMYSVYIPYMPNTQTPQILSNTELQITHCNCMDVPGYVYIIILIKHFKMVLSLSLLPYNYMY